MDITNVCAYCRVSTDTKDQENSFENQKTYFEREINKNPNYSLIKIYTDRGISGTSLSRREGFNELLRDAGLDVVKVGKEQVYIVSKERKPLFNLILVKNTSRFARNVEVITIIRKLRSNGVYIQFLDIDLTTQKDDYEFVLNLFLNFDQQDSIDKSKKVKFGHYESARKGAIFTNTRIYGYEYTPKKQVLKIIEEEAIVIRHIYDLYVTKGFGCRKIINWLDENGYKTREGKRFGKTSIFKILSNEKYCGDLVRNKYDTGVVLNKTRPKLRPRKEWIIHEDRVPAIIERLLFEKAQEIRSSRSDKTRGIYLGHSDFAGLIKCGKCGATYHSDFNGGKSFYKCSTKKTRGIKVCDNINVTADYVYDSLEALQGGGLYETFQNNKAIQTDLLLEVRERIVTNLEKDNLDDVLAKQKELTVLENKKAKLLDLFLNDSFDKERLVEKNQLLERDIERVKNEIAELSKERPTYLADIDDINSIIAKIRTLGIKKFFSKEEIVDNIKSMVVTRDEMAPQNPFISFELKFFDEINRYITKYSNQSQGRTDLLQLHYTEDRVKD
ncbi:recombinase family protein [Thermoactinomyces sp. DSM 45892]|uniref:recombinase family protein n=1 Tax=Thermoactinomyces sp. DSM 45892 TaxID=1882753 RepID=UPI00089AFBA5|nr:recombinase family protein [Thermoactinomyces sp. DSM 45892]SDX92625.1 Site-specific DNA recombinase [Thermoactinomyces sp. DSM 45892]